MSLVYKYTNIQSGSYEYSLDEDKYCDERQTGYVSRECWPLDGEYCTPAPVQQEKAFDSTPERMKPFLAMHGIAPQEFNAFHVGFCCGEDFIKEQPAQRKPLTPEWIWTWLMDWCKRSGTSPANHDSLFKMVSDARAIEAAHGIKE